MPSAMVEVTAETLQAFADAWNRHDVDALMSFMTEDCVFEASAGPDVCGTRYVGRDAVRAGFAEVWATFPDAHWGDARHFVSGDRGVSEWTFTGTRADGTRVEVHGCDLFTFRDGKIALKNSFRKSRPPQSRLTFLFRSSLYWVSRYLPGHEREAFLVAGIFGLVTFIAVDGLCLLMEGGEESVHTAHRASAALFLYLEVLDASFSFDGVIGAFALSNNLFVIAIGLGIGAMFVRSLTIMLVNKGTLTEYRYLEHGAFYAIVALGVIMFLKTLLHVPEAVTGLIGAAFIGVSFFHSVRANHHEARETARVTSRNVP